MLTEFDVNDKGELTLEGKTLDQWEEIISLQKILDSNYVDHAYRMIRAMKSFLADKPDNTTDVRYLYDKLYAQVKKIESIMLKNEPKGSEPPRLPSSASRWDIKPLTKESFDRVMKESKEREERFKHCDGSVPPEHANIRITY